MVLLGSVAFPGTILWLQQECWLSSRGFAEGACLKQEYGHYLEDIRAEVGKQGQETAERSF